MVNFNDKITDDFTWKEMFKSEISTRYGIDNTTQDESILNNIRYLTENILQPVREKFGPLRITSGYRCQQVNNLAGGSKTSNHMEGIAADIEPIDTSIKLADILTYIEEELDYHELIAEYFPDGWIHVAYKYHSKTLKLKDISHNYTHVSLEEIQRLYL